MRWSVQPSSAEFPAVAGLCGVVAACHQAADRHHVADGAERLPEWRYYVGTQGNGCARMDQSRKPRGGMCRVAARGLDHADPARRTAGLQPVGAHVVRAELRPQEAGRGRRAVPARRLDGATSGGCRHTHSSEAGDLEAGSENSFACPATEQESGKTFRHGTKPRRGNGRKLGFVPPRNEIHGFPGVHRSATGHLSEDAIPMALGKSGEVKQ
ncbi:hypothetical protein BSY238_104 [Methyloversatilis sp. RAC08]|nr:hypothetical protein BSY238_104 [Methyloversatilis sp. RAC08]